MNRNQKSAILHEQELQIERFRTELEKKLRSRKSVPKTDTPLTREDESAIDDFRFLCQRTTNRNELIYDLRLLMKKHARTLLNLE